MDVARGAEDRAAEFGLMLTFGDSARDINRESSYLQLFEQQRVQGVLISPYGDVADKLSQLAALPQRECRGQHGMGEIPGCIFAPKLLNLPIDLVDSVGLGDIMDRKTNQPIEADQPSNPGAEN
jgi:hypothetical protein